jgi:hypothetical protein
MSRNLSLATLLVALGVCALSVTAYAAIKNLTQLRKHEVTKLNKHNEGKFYFSTSTTADGAPILLISSSADKDIAPEYLELAASEGENWSKGTYQFVSGGKNNGFWFFIGTEWGGGDVTDRNRRELNGKFSDAITTFMYELGLKQARRPIFKGDTVLRFDTE